MVALGMLVWSPVRPNVNLGAVEAAVVVVVVVVENEKRGFGASLFGASAGFVAATGMLDLNTTGFTGTRSSGGFMATVLSTGWALGAA